MKSVFEMKLAFGLAFLLACTALADSPRTVAEGKDNARGLKTSAGVLSATRKVR